MFTYVLLYIYDMYVLWKIKQLQNSLFQLYVVSTYNYIIYYN